MPKKTQTKKELEKTVEECSNKLNAANNQVKKLTKQTLALQSAASNAESMSRVLTDAAKRKDNLLDSYAKDIKLANHMVSGSNHKVNFFAVVALGALIALGVAVYFI